MIVPYVILLGVLAIFLQILWPPITLVDLGSYRETFRILFLPMVMIYGALRIQAPWVYFVAGVLGFATDLLSSNRLGTTVIILTILTTLIVTQQETRFVTHWYNQIFLVLLGTFLYAVLEYIGYLLQINALVWADIVWLKLAFASLVNAVLTPLVFFLFDLLPHACGWVTRRQPSRQYALRAFR